MCLTKTVVHAHGNDRRLCILRVAHYAREIVLWIRRRSSVQSTAVDPDKHRQLLIRISAWAYHYRSQQISLRLYFFRKLPLRVRQSSERLKLVLYW